MPVLSSLSRLPALAVVLLACAAPAAQAACEGGLAERLQARLHPGRVLDAELAACKPWPARPGQRIVVLPLEVKKDDTSRTLDLDVLLVQEEGAGAPADGPRVLAHVLQREELSEDAVMVRGIDIDTARYQLAPDALAFGVRVRYVGSSRANPYGSDTLRLYLPRGDALRPVLDEVEVSGSSGEWDTNCAGRFEEVRGVVAVRPTASAGLADLALVRKSTPSVASVVKGGECKEQPGRPVTTTTLLRYDGQQYRPAKTP